MASPTGVTSTSPADLGAAMDRSMAAQVDKAKSVKAGNAAEADKVAREFEAMFLSSMLQPVFAGVKPSKTFGGGHGEETFKAMLVDEYGKVMAKRGGLGIADMVRQQILQTQEVG
jgi:Rod binding domain-containing protein